MAQGAELLSPCGSYAALEAAVFAGADAVYLGGKSFNARMGARNFENDDIARAVKFCHGNGVRLFVTLNTVIYDRAINSVMEYVTFLYNCGVDALIVCDLGLISLIRERFPDFELHASTQMAGNNLAAARFVCGLGLVRMVAARELDEKNIRTLCAHSPVEIEVFIHGALCASQSGGCLMSSVIGARSGNRGECAQPCRLPYNGSHPLSLKDNCLAAHMRSLLNCGVKSLKIEGRMKSPAYVYGVTAKYRELIDQNRDATGKEIAKLASIFSRSGFTDGYFTANKREMTGTRTDENKDSSKGASVGKKLHRRLPAVVISREKAEFTAPPSDITDGSTKKSLKMNTARFQKAEQIPNGDFFDIKYLPLDRYSPRANGIILPPVIPDSEYEKVREMIEKARENGAKHLIFCNIGQIELALESGMEIHPDYRFNVCNSHSAAFMEKYGDVMLSPELTLPQVRDIKHNKAVIVYGRLPLMTLEIKTGAKTLRDRRAVKFPVLTEGGREIVYNSVPIYMADRQDALKKAGITNRHFIFSTESKSEVEGIITAYKNSEPAKAAVTRIKAK